MIVLTFFIILFSVYINTFTSDFEDENIKKVVPITIFIYICVLAITLVN